MLGTIINTIAVLIGGLIGTLFGNKIPESYSAGIMKVMGFITAAIGIQGAAGTKSFLVVVLSLVIGTLIGMVLRLDDRINGAGDWARRNCRYASRQRPLWGRRRHLFYALLHRQHDDPRLDTRGT